MKKRRLYLLVLLLTFVMIAPRQTYAEDPGSQGTGGVISIKSFDDLKPYLEVKSVSEPYVNDAKRLLLKGGIYSIDADFAIDLADPYFSDKEEIIRYGILSATDPVTINGNGKTISMKQKEAVALFGSVVAPSYSIKDLNVSYPGNVKGFAFANTLIALNDGEMTPESKAVANGTVENIKVEVGGDVAPLDISGAQGSTHVIGNLKGKIASGFAWNIKHSNFDKISIDVKGNIGDTVRPASETDMVAAYGFTHHFGNARYLENKNGATYKAFYKNNNPEVLKDIGHIMDLTIHVGGNIQAYGNNVGYAYGVGYDMGQAWMERANITVDGDLVCDLQGNNTPINHEYSYPRVYGFSEELMALKDSNLTVNNIIFKGKDLSNSRNYAYIGAMAEDNSKGNYVCLKNNNVTVNEKISGKTNGILLSTIGFNNTDLEISENGVNWLHENNNNKFKVGSIDLEGGQAVSFYSLGSKWRTIQRTQDKAPLPETSLMNNKVETGDIAIKAPIIQSGLLMEIASNAKNNQADYGNITLEGDSTHFSGLGDLKKDESLTRVAENNHITFKDLTITTKDAPCISLLAGFQYKDQPMKDCTVKAGKVKIDMASTKDSWIGGIAAYSQDNIENCRAFVDSVEINNTGDKDLYFGLGTAHNSGGEIMNSGVFVDGPISINSPNLLGGGFIGYAKYADISNNDYQIDGKHTVATDGKNSIYGGFAGRLNKCSTEKNTSLLLSDFQPFAFRADGGIIDGVAHYVNGKAPQFYCGLLAVGSYDPSFDLLIYPTIKNSTLLVEKQFEDTILYRKDSVMDSGEDNYLVVVDNEDDMNRKAYKTAVTTAKEGEMEGPIDVIKKIGEPVGKINIAARSFQDKYWNEGVVPSYDIGDAEKNFPYMTANDAGTISVIGLDKEKIIGEGGKKGMLYDYDHRHAGLISDGGIVYDLLGIKGSLQYSVIYDGNGADGGQVPVDSKRYVLDKKVTVLSAGSMVRKGYLFAGWNTKADGSGTAYQAGDIFKIKGNTVLYAQWDAEPNNPNTPDNHPKGSTLLLPPVDTPLLNRKDHAQYMIGYPDQNFKPDNHMSRQEVTVMFSRLLNERPQKGMIYSRDYKDIPDDLWSATAISYMSKLNMVKGYPDGNFMPRAAITRAEFAAMATRFADISAGSKTFTDVAKGHWAYDVIQKAAGAG